MFRTWIVALLIAGLLAACSTAPTSTPAPTDTPAPQLGETLDWTEQQFRMAYPSDWIAEFVPSSGTYTLVQQEGDLRRGLAPQAPILLIGVAPLGDSTPSAAALLQNFIALLPGFQQPELRPLPLTRGYEALIGRGTLGTPPDDRSVAASVLVGNNARAYLLLAITPPDQAAAFEPLLLAMLDSVSIGEEP